MQQRVSLRQCHDDILYQEPAARVRERAVDVSGLLLEAKLRIRGHSVLRDAQRPSKLCG
jgi:hypothetical protein